MPKGDPLLYKVKTEMMSTAKLPDRLYSLDSLRGFAALAIVFFHWKHFFYEGSSLAAFDQSRQPFYGVLWPFYLHGWQAVDLFFCLSGFIFFLLYAQRIADRHITVGAFSLLRFSRLYPLHLATLLIVALEQWFIRSLYGTFLAYPNNDWFHFVLHLLFVSALWSPEEAAFNGPSWSISVEVTLYALFYLVCWSGVRRWWHLSLIVLAGLVFGSTHIGRGLLSFFVGGLAFKLFSCVRKKEVIIKPAALLVITASVWSLAAIEFHYNAAYRTFCSVLGDSRFIGGRDIGGALLLILSNHSFQLIVFPCTVICLALIEAWRGTLGRRLAFLGDISYSSYLLHFPLQLAFLIVISLAGIERSVFYSPVTMVLFFGCLLIVSLLSYHYFERPIQRLLRGQLALGNVASNKVNLQIQSA